MEKESKECQYHYLDMMEATSPDTLIAGSLQRYWWILKYFILYTIPLGLLGSSESAILSLELNRSKIPFIRLLGEFATRRRKKAKKVHAVNRKGEALNLQAGEWVRVRLAKEIFATLDEQGKYKGLGFMPEMIKFCGKRFRVYKRVNRIKLEATGELRKLKAPTVFLEGVFCDGEFHQGCDRSCFCYWREAWLERVSP